MTDKRKYRVFQTMMALAGLAIFILAIWTLVREASHLSLAEIEAQFSAIPLRSFLKAGLFTVASYVLLTFYDVLAFRYIGVSQRYAMIAPIAFSAFAVGHNVGVSSLSGGAIRYRAYSLAGLTTTQIGAIVAFVPLTFTLGALTLLGLTLVLEPVKTLSSVPLGVDALRAIGLVLVALPLLWLLVLAIYRKPLVLGQWCLQLPSAGLGLSQLLLSALDLVATSCVMYMLVSAAAPVPYLVFLGAFLLALMIGVVSTVPGAIGVFESAMLLLLPEVPAPALVGAMLAYRLIYYLIPLLLAVVLIVARELFEHKHHLQALSESGFAWATRLVPQAIGVVVFIAGAYLLVRGSIPFDFGSHGSAGSVLPLPLLETSNLLSSAIGSGLLIVARGLYRRLRRALLAALLLLAAAVVTAFFRHSGFAHIAFLLLLLLLVWESRAEFYRGKRLLDQSFHSGWIVNILLVLIAVLGVGLIAQRNVEYSNELWWQFTVNGDASRMLRAALLALVLVGVFALIRLLRGNPPVPAVSSAQELQLVKSLVAASPTSFANIALLGDKQFLFHPSQEAFLMYRISRGSCIALGDPVGKSELYEELIWQFREICDATNMRCVFYHVSNRYLPLYLDLGLSFLKLGEEGIVDLNAFSLEGSQHAEFRHAINKARRNGAEFSVITAAETRAVMPELARVSDSWLKGKSSEEKSFSVGRFTPEYIASFDCAVVRVNGEIVAFANVWKSAQGKELSVDLMRYSDQAPKAIMDYLFTEIMLWGKAQGFAGFSLGMAPLSGLEHHPLASSWHKVGNLIYRFGENFYNFEGLRHYKEKYSPQWQPRFLACKGGLQVPSVLLDTTLLISGGVKGILSK